MRIIEEAIPRILVRVGALRNHIFGEPLPENGMVWQQKLKMTQPRVTRGTEKLILVKKCASEQLNSLLDRQGRPEGALRIKVIGGGCSGLQYQMDLVDGPLDRDILVESSGVRVVIDPKSALFVGGSELEYSADLQHGGFKVSNPNAVVTCSCGESFAA